MITVVSKGSVTKAALGDITHDRVLGISVNIPTKAFCPPMCFLFYAATLFLYATFGRIIDWVGWR